MSGVGRNIPCPCMSGKKFKKCCQISGALDFFRQQGLNYYDEGHVVARVIQDENFMKFYMNERRKIRKPIYFLQSSQLNSKASFGNLDDKSGYLIVTPHSQVPVSEAIHLAHEVEHITLCSEGYKVVTTKNQNTRIHKMLNDMIYDPILNKRLIQYGFDLPPYLELADEIQIRTIGVNSPHYENHILVLTLYVKKYLDYKNLYPEIQPGEVEFNKWVKQHYAGLISKSEEIINVVNETGFETPDQAEETLWKTMEILDLHDKFDMEHI